VPLDPTTGIIGTPLPLHGQRTELADKSDDAIGPVRSAVFGDVAMQLVDIGVGEGGDLALASPGRMWTLSMER
jgi:hypothetical protein